MVGNKLFAVAEVVPPADRLTVLTLSDITLLI